MGIYVVTVFLSFFIFSNSIIFAATNQLNSNYPAQSGSYNKLVINTQPGSIDCSLSSNNGLLFMYTDAFQNQSLETCANGAIKPIPYPQTCFNRYSSTDTFNGCPNGYAMAQPGGVPIHDSFSSGGYTIHSIVCCNNGNGSVVNPS
jgi:hypothetical protein